jgi:hypothetical protein
MDHMNIRDTSINPITLLHAMYQQHDINPNVHQHQHFNATRIFKCLHMKLKFIKNRKKPYGQISTIAISVITPITGYILTVMVSIAYTQFKESIQIYREILGNLMIIIIILSGLKNCDIDDYYKKGEYKINTNKQNGLMYRLNALFGKIIVFPEILLKHMTRESNDTINRTLGIEPSSQMDNKSLNNRRNMDDVIDNNNNNNRKILMNNQNDFLFRESTLNDIGNYNIIYIQKDLLAIEAQIVSMLKDVHEAERSARVELNIPEFTINELACIRDKLKKLFELSFGLQSLYQTRLPENLHYIITFGGMGVYILMIPAFWSIYGWIFGTIVIMVCAICFIAVLEGIDRMNPIFDSKNPMYHEIITENQMTIVRMKNIYGSIILDESENRELIYSTNKFNQKEHFKSY